MSHNPPARRTLADIIQEKITEKQTEIQSQMTGELGLMNLRLIPRKFDVWLKTNIASSVASLLCMQVVLRSTIASCTFFHGKCISSLNETNHGMAHRSLTFRMTFI